MLPGKAGWLFPTRLLPDTVQIILIHCVTLFTVHRDLSFLCRVAELAVTASLRPDYPAVCLQEVKYLFYFVSFHISCCLTAQRYKIFYHFQKYDIISYTFIYNSTSERKERKDDWQELVSTDVKGNHTDVFTDVFV